MSIKGTLCRFGVLRLTTSHTQYYKKMDEFGGNFDKIIKSDVEKDCNFLWVRQSQMETPQTVAVTASDEPNLPLSGQGHTQCDTDNQLTSEHPTIAGLLPTAGGKIVFDNFDFATKVHNMNQDHQNSDVHWVTHMAVNNRVSGNYLPSGKPICDILCLENGKCLPNIYEHHLQRENYITLTERFIVEIPCLYISFLESVVIQSTFHINTQLKWLNLQKQ